MYDEKVLVGLDFAINEASKRGIRVVPVFANYWAMVRPAVLSMQTPALSLWTFF